MSHDFNPNPSNPSNPNDRFCTTDESLCTGVGGIMDYFGVCLYSFYLIQLFTMIVYWKSKSMYVLLNKYSAIPI